MLKSFIAITALTCSVMTMPARAEPFPSKNVDYIIPFGPGGESDIAARLQQPLFAAMTSGRQLIVSYKPGGGGAVAWSQLNEMAGDGYSWMGVNLPHIIVKPMEKAVGFKTEDLTNVYMFHFTPDALLVNADSPLKSAADLIAYAKANPGRLTLSGSGKGSSNHLAHLKFSKLAGVSATYVPFKGTGDAMTALLGNQVAAEWGYTTVASAQEGKVRMLAVATEKRHPAFPDVPTFRELGFDLIGGAYRGLAVPKSTPEDLRRQISDVIGKINTDPQFVKQMEDNGFTPIDVAYGAPMDAFMAKMAAEYAEVLKDIGN